jgi:MYXO-CTERM domain-containing protein
MLSRLAVVAVVLSACIIGAGEAAAQVSVRADDTVDYVVVDPAPPVFHAGPDILYLNRCAQGCSASSGRDDAVNDRSSILGRDGIPSSVDIAPFMWDDATWNGLVECVRATYAIYGVDVVTEPPSTSHVEVMVAGTAAALGLPGNTLGIAPLANDCSPLPSAIAFAFANAHLSGPELVTELCATTAHEAGHIYGLDHEFECKDPMTYLTGCGIKVFLNRTVACGEFDEPRECKCGERQSSHRHLYVVLGPGTPPSPPPITVRSPVPGATVTSTFSVFVDVDGRPATTVELWINGAQFAALPGKLTDSPYELVTPASLFDGVLDLEVRVYDDLGTLGTANLTVQKGSACVNADTCPDGHQCDAGRCLAPPGLTRVGEPCAAQGECASKECVSRGGESVCTQPCWEGTGGCPGGMACIQGDDERFACFVPDEGGCCSASSDPRASLAFIGLIGLALLRPRRSRRRDRVTLV